jgi:hypothetical protein
VLGVVAVTGAVVLGVVLAGSPSRIAAGVSIDGVNVGGLTAARPARSSSAAQPHWRRFPSPSRPAATPGACAGQPRRRDRLERGGQARARPGDGLGPIRGFRRLGVRVFGADVSPPTRVIEKSLAYEVGRISRAVDRPHRDAALVLRRLQPVVVPARAGRSLDREAAGSVIVQSPRGLRAAAACRFRSRATSRTCAAQTWLRRREGADGARAARADEARRRLVVAAEAAARGDARAPDGGTSKLRVGGPGATRYFAKLGRGIDKPARDATFRRSRAAAWSSSPPATGASCTRSRPGATCSRRRSRRPTARARVV